MHNQVKHSINGKIIEIEARRIIKLSAIIDAEREAIDTLDQEVGYDEETGILTIIADNYADGIMTMKKCLKNIMEIQNEQTQYK